MKTLKKSLALLLALVMCLSAASITAFAEENGGQSIAEEEQNAVKTEEAAKVEEVGADAEKVAAEAVEPGANADAVMMDQDNTLDVDFETLDQILLEDISEEKNLDDANVPDPSDAVKAAELANDFKEKKEAAPVAEKKEEKVEVVDEEEKKAAEEKTTTGTTVTLTLNAGDGAFVGLPLDGWTPSPTATKNSPVTELSQKVTAGTPVDISGIEPTQNGYALAGWSRAGTKETISGDALKNVAIDSDTTFTAVWVPTVTLTINLNGGSLEGKNDPIEVEKPLSDKYVKFTVDDQPTRSDGYVFLGWSTDPGATRPVNCIVPEGELAELLLRKDPYIYIKTNEDLEIYAVWGEPTVTLTLNANGGTFKTTPEGWTPNTDGTISLRTNRTDGKRTAHFDIPEVTLEREDGYRFLGWSYVSDAWGVDVAAPKAETETGTESGTATNTSPSVASQSSDARQATPLPESFFKAREPESFVDRVYDTTLYAVWAKENVTLTLSVEGDEGAIFITGKMDEDGNEISTAPEGWGFPEDKNGNIGKTMSSTVPTSNTVEVTFSIPSNVPQRPGFTFLGWTDVKGSEEVKYAASTTVTGGLLSKAQSALQTLGATLVGSTAANTSKSNAQQATKEHSVMTWPFISIDESTTLYAVWQKNTATLILDANGGTFTDEEGKPIQLPSVDAGKGEKPWERGKDNKTISWTVDRGDNKRPEFDIPDIKPTRVDEYGVTYEFKGWAENADGTGTIFKAKSDTSVGGLVEEVKKVFTPAGSAVLVGSTTSNSTKSAMESIIQLPPSTVTVTAEEKTLYAIWVREDVTLVLDANGGKFTDEDDNPLELEQNWKYLLTADDKQDSREILINVPKKDTSIVAIPGTVPYREGWTFLGWSTDPKATSAWYWHDDTPLAGLEKAAEKSAELVTKVLTDPTGGVVLVGSTTSNSTKSDRKTITDHNNFRFKSDDVVVLYAVWAKKDVTLTLNVDAPDAYFITREENKDGSFIVVEPPKGWEFGEDDKTMFNTVEDNKKVEVSFQIPSTLLYRKDYTFRGWTDERGSTVVKYKPSTAEDQDLPTSITIREDTTLYAVWGQNTVTVHFLANGGDFKDAIEARAAEEEAARLAAEEARLADEEAAKLVDAKLPDEEAAKLPALGGERLIFIDFDSGKSPRPEPKKLLSYKEGFARENTEFWMSLGGEYGEKVFKWPDVQPTQTGYKFVGWASKDNPTTPLWPDPEVGEIKTDKDLSYVAVWVGNDDALRYDANGGTGTMGEKTGKVGDTVAIAVNAFALDGYTFAGWNTAADGSGDSYASGGDYTLTPGEDVLYAQWRAKDAPVSEEPTDPETPAEPTEETEAPEETETTEEPPEETPETPTAPVIPTPVFPTTFEPTPTTIPDAPTPLAAEPDAAAEPETIADEPAPLAEEPEAEVIEDEETPLAELPEDEEPAGKPEEELLEIEDEETPLADTTPKTDDASRTALWMTLSVLSLGGALLLNRKRDEEEA